MHENGSHRQPHPCELHPVPSSGPGWDGASAFSSLRLKFIPTSERNRQEMIWEYGVYDFVYTWFLIHTWLPLPDSRLSEENKLFSAWLSWEMLLPPTQQKSRKSCVLVTSMVDKVPMQKNQLFQSHIPKASICVTPNTASAVPICLSLAGCPQSRSEVYRMSLSLPPPPEGHRFSN